MSVSFCFGGPAECASKEIKYSKNGEHFKAFNKAIEDRGRGLGGAIVGIPIIVASGTLAGVITAVASPILAPDNFSILKLQFS